jgi:uncharacterized repeat protein (TIGR02543 family)
MVVERKRKPVFLAVAAALLFALALPFMAGGLTAAANRSFTVRFELEYGTGVASPIHITNDEMFGVWPANPTRLGFIFEGWYTAPLSGGTEVTEATVMELSGDTYLYARWARVTGYTVTFSLQGGEGNIPPQTVPNGGTVTLPADPTHPDGHDFGGWFTQSGGRGEEIYRGKEDFRITGNIILYAYWIGLNYIEGDAVIDNMSPRIGDTLTGSVVNGVNTGVLTYTWMYGETVLQTGASATYMVVLADLGRTISLVITSDIEFGELESTATAAVEKKAAPSTPAAPTVIENGVTNNSVTLAVIAGGEYRMGAGGEWQSSPVFSGLLPNTSYTFYQRIAETADTYASLVSEALTVTTLKNPGPAIPVQPETPEAAEGEEVTRDSITVAAVVDAPVGYTVEYGIATGRDGEITWQAGREFTDLAANTTYYFFARVAAGEANEAGEPRLILIESTDRGSNAGAIFGATFGGAAVLIIAGAVLLAAMKKKKKTEDEKALEAVAASDKDNKFIMYKKIK